VDWCEIFPWLCPVLTGALLVGSPFSDIAAVDAGAAYIFAGGLAVDAIPDMTMRGTQADAHFGMSVASVGDYNGDRIGDFAIGAPDEDGFYPTILCPDMGRVRVGLFDPRCMVINPWPDPGPNPWFDVFDGEAAGDRFGLGLDGADLNRDGLSDLVVAAPNHDGPAGTDAGRVYAFWGRVRPRASTGDIGPNHAVDPDWLVDGTAASEKLGAALGISDIVEVQPQPEPPNPDGPAPARLRTRCSRYAAATIPTTRSGAASATIVDPEFLPRPMLGADLLLAGDDGVLRLHDVSRYHLSAPLGTATWNVGSLQSVSWKGAEPAAVQLSIDGGASYKTLVVSPGGKAKNSISLRVPHSPTRFGTLSIIPWPPCPEPDPFGLTCPPFAGFAQSETLFTIQTSVTLLSFNVAAREADAELTWSSEPGVGPEGIAGYRLYRVAPGEAGDGARIGPDLIVEGRYLDPDARAGSTYRLAAVNGLGEEVELGRMDLGRAVTGMLAFPSPAPRNGVVSVAFAAPMAAPGVAATDLDVGVFDVGGRRVATLAGGYVRPVVGLVQLEWRPADRGGRAANPGVYFIRALAPSAGFRLERKVVVMP
jgi:hypothetical protein